MSELELMRFFMAECAVHLPNVRVFRRDIINADVQKNGRHFHMRAGIKGQADLYAYVDGGRVVELETKAARGTLADEQKTWRAFCIERRIPHLVLRAKPKEYPAETVERWIAELRAVVAQTATNTACKCALGLPA
jgi:hypothetical protein